MNAWHCGASLSECMYVQNVEQLHVSSECNWNSATEYLKSTHREAGLAISMLHTGLSSARRKEADESTLAALFDVRLPPLL